MTTPVIETLPAMAGERSPLLKVLRLDLIHPVTGGNKIFKLKENIQEYRTGNYTGILSFGGPFSNHIAALAETGKSLGIPTIGIIRGEERMTVTLERARRAGLQLRFVSRSTYRRYREAENRKELLAEFGNVLIIPEGGSNDAGISGCKEIAGYIPQQHATIVLPVGTGATLVGLLQGLNGRNEVIGMKVVEAKQEIFIAEKLLEGSSKLLNYNLLSDYVFGGYARPDMELDTFVADWNRKSSCQIEPIYTGRMFFGIMDLIQKGFFSPTDEILAIHTGGLQYLHD